MGVVEEHIHAFVVEVKSAGVDEDGKMSYIVNKAAVRQETQNKSCCPLGKLEWGLSAGGHRAKRKEKER